MVRTVPCNPLTSGQTCTGGEAENGAVAVPGCEHDLSVLHSKGDSCHVGMVTEVSGLEVATDPTHHEEVRAILRHDTRVPGQHAGSSDTQAVAQGLEDHDDTQPVGGHDEPPMSVSEGICAR